MKGQTFLRRLGFAVNGLALAFRREASVRIQVLAAVAVTAVLLVLQPPAIWWALYGLVVGLVLVAEMINTALETLADRLHPEQHSEIGAAKDIAAGAVLNRQRNRCRHRNCVPVPLGSLPFFK